MDNTEASRRQVVISALSMAMGTASSRILGLVREIAFAALFPKMVTDAWTTAWRLPNLFRRLLGEGSLSVSFLPVYVEQKVQDPTGKSAQELLNSFWTLLLLFLVVLSGLGTIFAQQSLSLFLDSRFEMAGEKMELTVHFARIMFSFIFFITVYAFWMAVLNAVGKFAWAAMAPTFFNVAMILSTLIPQSLFAVQGEALAWGVLIGGIIQAGVLIPQLKREGVFPRLTLHIRVRGLGRVFRNLAPGLLGSGLMQLTTLVNLNFASSLREGSISYIYWADRLLELPLSLISVSLGTALLPTLSKLWSEGKREQWFATFQRSLFVNLFLAMPAAVGLAILSSPIISFLFQRGHFQAEDVTATAGVLSIYGLNLIASSLVRVFVPSFYAIQNTWFPAVASLLGLIFHLVAAPILMASPLFFEGSSNAPLFSLVLSSALSAYVNLGVLYVGFLFLVGSFHFSRLFVDILKLFVATVAMAGVCFFIQKYFYEFNAIVGAAFLVVGIFGAAAVFFVLAHLLGIEEAQTIVRSLRKKFLKS